MKAQTRPVLLTALFFAFLAAVFMAPTSQGATLVVANKAEATASLIDLKSGEVIATLPTDQVLVTEYRQQARRDLLEQLVAIGMTMAVVDVLEVVQVNKKYRERGRAPAGPDTGLSGFSPSTGRGHAVQDPGRHRAGVEVDGSAEPFHGQSPQLSQQNCAGG